MADGGNVGLTTDKLSEIKKIFEEVCLKKGTDIVNLDDLRASARASSISENDMNIFFKDLITKGGNSISKTDFDKLSNKIEKILLEMCLGDRRPSVREENEYVGNSIMNQSESTFSLPKEGEKLEGQCFSPDDYSIDEYIASIKDMLSHTLKNDNYLEMSLADIAKLVKDLNNYIGIVKKKAEKLNDELKEVKNTLENKEYQESFLQNKITNYQDTIDELQAAKDKLERDVEQLFAMEEDFKRLKDRNAELDIELLSSTAEIEKLTTENNKMACVNLKPQ